MTQIHCIGIESTDSKDVYAQFSRPPLLPPSEAVQRAMKPFPLLGPHGPLGRRVAAARLDLYRDEQAPTAN